MIEPVNHIAPFLAITELFKMQYYVTIVGDDNEAKTDLYDDAVSAQIAFADAVKADKKAGKIKYAQHGVLGMTPAGSYTRPE